jgi:RNA polymerase sigma-70 factor (ECF subfamily)
MSEARELDREDAEGLNRLYRRYADWLGERLSRRVGTADAADLVQETYLRIAPGDTSGIRHPKAFLMRVAMNLLRDKARREKRRLAAHDEIGRNHGYTLQPDALLLKQIIQSMPPLYRDVFVLSRFGGMTYNQIAILQGVSVKTVEWRISKALEHCAQRLDE